MKRIVAMLLGSFLLVLACTPVGLTSKEDTLFNVEKLDLRDPRLSDEARRWLADAEDEVEIAKAHVDDARAALERVRQYRDGLSKRLKKSWGKSGADAVDAYEEYTDTRVALRGIEFLAKEMALELAVVRLAQARAETAMRHDLAVYKLDPIVDEVSHMRAKVAEIEEKAAKQRQVVEKRAEAAWVKFTKFVRGGGVVNSLWSSGNWKTK